MASIIGAMAASHSPLMINNFDEAPKEQKDNIVGGFDKLKEMVEQLKPDVILSIGNDHLRELDLSNMPQFIIGIGESNKTMGDFNLPKVTIRNHQGLAQHLLNYSLDHDFDLSYSVDLNLDHGHSQTLYYINPSFDIPVIPMIINSVAHPNASLKRCYRLGEVLRNAILSFEDDIKVLIVASGGLSHWPSTLSIFNGHPANLQSEDDQRMFAIISGKDHSDEAEQFRIQRSKKMSEEGKTGRVNAEWDRWFLKCFESGNITDIINLSWQDIMDNAGGGGQEVRNWVCLWGAINGVPAEVISYEPVREWVTGMAIASFKV